MSFSYSGDPTASSIDKVRFAVGDTREVGHLLEDEEIDYMAATASSETALLAAAYRQVATILGARTVKRTLGPQSEDGTARLKYFQQMADKYDTLASYGGTPPLPEVEDPIFDKHMMANEE